MKDLPASFVLWAVAVVTGVTGCGASHDERSNTDRNGGQSAPSRVTATERRPLTLAVVAIDAQIGRDRVISAGSVIDPDRGLVLTSAHTVWGARSLRLGTGLGVLYGRIVARAPCEDVALVETQPRLPGLVALTPDREAAVRSDDRVTVVSRVRGDPNAGSQALLMTRTRSRSVVTGAQMDPGLPHVPGAVRLGRLVAESSGAPVLDRRNRLVAMALTAGGGVGGATAAIPAPRITRLLGELRPGRKRLYRGWNRYYHCASRLHSYAHAAHPGFRRADARLGRSVPATRLPGTGELNR
jgi:hypothetical protein